MTDNPFDLLTALFIKLMVTNISNSIIQLVLRKEFYLSTLMLTLHDQETLTHERYV